MGRARTLHRIMPDVILINAYTRATAEKIKELLGKYTADSWLEEHESEVFQVCDELIKNAVKSNYRFALEWMLSRTRLLQENPHFTEDQADEELYRIFFDHENDSLEQHLSELGKREQIKMRVRELLNMESMYASYKDGVASNEELRNMAGGDRDLSDVLPLLKIKKLNRDLQINIHFHIEKTPEDLVIMISNDSPMIEEDFARIRHVRDTFAAYQDEGKEMEFFTENLDLEGGGHGLGYAIMDAILYQLGLDPDSSLFVVAATRTLILLVLPFDPGTSPLRIRETVEPSKASE